MIDFKRMRGKSPTPKGGYKKTFVLDLQIAEEVIKQGPEEAGRYFTNLVLYELYGEVPQEMQNETIRRAFDYQAEELDKRLTAYLKSCETNYKNSKQERTANEPLTNR